VHKLLLVTRWRHGDEIRKDVRAGRLKEDNESFQVKGYLFMKEMEVDLGVTMAEF
jgi:hypothetical protein